MMSDQIYSEPVQQLLKLGLPKIHEWPNYTSMDVSAAHIPELIQVVKDEYLRWVYDSGADEDQPEWYAQIHAWRALGQLKAEQAIPALTGILHQVDDYDDDWTGEELMDVFAMIGPVTIPALSDYLADYQNKTYARGVAGGALNKIATDYPDTREKCVAALAAALERYEQNDETINAFIISDLVDLKAVEHIGLIEQAFQAEKVEEIVRGDFEDIQVDLGLLEERKTPPRRPAYIDDLMAGYEREMTIKEKIISQQKAKQEKAKRKMEKLSRKKNRKKKK